MQTATCWQVYPHARFLYFHARSRPVGDTRVPIIARPFRRDFSSNAYHASVGALGPISNPPRVLLRLQSRATGVFPERNRRRIGMIRRPADFRARIDAGVANDALMQMRLARGSDAIARVVLEVADNNQNGTRRPEA